MIEIDGSMGEGGGQVLRTSIALSAMTGKECRISNIRAGRPKPGLAAQHLTGILGIAELSGAEVIGAHKGSTEIVFKPGEVGCHDLWLDVGTAGSVTLVLQACLLAVIGSGQRSKVTITGGTNVKWSPPVDYLEWVLFPMLEKMGVEIKMETGRRGFYPQGGGEVTVWVTTPRRLRPLDVRERGELLELKGICFSQNLPDHVCKRISHSVKKALLGMGDARISYDRREGISTGTGICLFARCRGTTLGADCLGEKGLPSEEVGKKAAQDLLCEMDGGGTLDFHAADQILPYMALADGPSFFSVREASGHLKTLIALLPLFLDMSINSEKKDSLLEITVMPSRT